MRGAAAIVAVSCVALLGGCGLFRRPMPPPTRVVSFCHDGKHLDTMRLREVAAGVVDGMIYKSVPASLTHKAKSFLDEFGGGVAYWPNAAFHLPKYSAMVRNGHVEIIGLAVPDNGFGRNQRLVYLGFRQTTTGREGWISSTSADDDVVCR